VSGTSSDELVRVDHRDLEVGRAAILTLNRPEQLNPFDWDTVRAMLARFAEVDADPTVRTVLVTGAGRAFSAGGDMIKYQELQQDSVAFPQFVADFHAMVRTPRSMRAPVVALVNGVTAAGGLEMLLGCDLAFAGASAKIGDGHLNFGQMGGGGVLTLLPRLIGIQRATELILSGRFLTGAEAAAWGIVSRVVPDEELLAAGLGFAAEVCKKSPLAVANAKSVMSSVWGDSLSIEAGMRHELARNVYYCLTSADAREGLAAFGEKRRPNFEGR
jgi:enoyl-CoA hydratase